MCYFFYFILSSMQYATLSKKNNNFKSNKKWNIWFCQKHYCWRQKTILTLRKNEKNCSPISGQCFFFIPPENTRKAEILWCFQGTLVWNGLIPVSKSYCGKLYGSVEHRTVTMIDNLSLTHFIPVAAFYTPWKYQKKQRFSNVFRGYEKRPTAWNGLIKHIYNFLLFRFAE